ncbi:MAG: TOBE domain-containing protein, partial [Acetobacteraceae bacterium]|nr:TOBE domain-containing protein [Acetobacteraceae bacterium]
VQMRTEIKKVHQTVRTTTVYVTHDQVEAMTLADRVVVMNGGHIEQAGPPQELYHRPATRFVAGFIGSPAMNILPCQLVAEGNRLSVRLADGNVLPIPASRQDRYGTFQGREMLFGLRPEHLTEPRDYERAQVVPFTGVTDVVEPMGMETIVHFFVNGVPAAARLHPDTPAEPGQPLALAANMDQMHLIDPESGRVV